MNGESPTKTHELEVTGLQPRNQLRQLHQWMYERVLPFINGNVLEVGSGSGNISNLLIRNGIHITLSDADERFCRFLQKRYEGEPMINHIQQIDLSSEDFEETYHHQFESFDVIFSLNVLEHISLNRSAISNAKKLLVPGGYLIFFLPAYAALYRELDQGVDHWHRYNNQYIKRLLAKDLKIIKTRYFNLIGIVRMFLLGSDVKNSFLTNGYQSRYRKLVPTFCIEDLAFKQIGLSMITVAQKIQV